MAVAAAVVVAVAVVEVGGLVHRVLLAANPAAAPQSAVATANPLVAKVNAPVPPGDVPPRQGLRTHQGHLPLLLPRTVDFISCTWSAVGINASMVMTNANLPTHQLQVRRIRRGLRHGRSSDLPPVHVRTPPQLGLSPPAAQGRATVRVTARTVLPVGSPASDAWTWGVTPPGTR